MLSLYPNKQLFSSKHINYNNLLGIGSTSKVYSITDPRDSTKEYAVKIISKSFPKQSVMREISMYRMLNDAPDTLKMIDWFEDKLNYYIILEKSTTTVMEVFLDFAGLKRVTANKQQCTFEPAAKLDEAKTRSIPLQTIKHYVKDTVVCLMQIHDKGVIHLDVKLENLFIFPNGNVKIGDLGIAYYGNICLEPHGTIHTMAPEVCALFRRVEKSPLITKQADLWSLGIMVLELLTLKNVYEQGEEQKLLDGRYDIPPHVDPIAQDFVKKLLQKDPNQRMSLEDCLKHPFLYKNSPITFV